MTLPHTEDATVSPLPLMRCLLLSLALKRLHKVLETSSSSSAVVACDAFLSCTPFTSPCNMCSSSPLASWVGTLTCPWLMLLLLIQLLVLMMLPIMMPPTWLLAWKQTSDLGGPAATMLTKTSLRGSSLLIASFHMLERQITSSGQAGSSSSSCVMPGQALSSPFSGG